MRRYFVVLFISLICCYGYCQVRDFGLNLNEYNFLSAESFSMIKYGDAYADKYTGSFKYQIPIYTYSDPTFSIPISLLYNFSGFIPSQTNGVVGYAWSLNVGGVITREVRGVPDEHKSAEGLSGDDCSGYYYLKDNNIQENEDIVSIHSGLFSGGAVKLDKAIPSYLVGTRTSYYIVDGEWHQTLGDYTNYETTPDIFHFSINGRKGDFTITGRGGKCSAYMCDGAHGDYDIYFYTSSNPSEGYNSEILIIDKVTGLHYTFGGGIDYCEYTDYTDRDVGESDWPINAWKLKEILSPSGRKVEFIYSNPQVCLHKKEGKNDMIVYGSPTFDYHKPVSTYNNGTYSLNYYSVYRLLDCIKVDGAVIAKFNYSNISKKESNISRAPHEAGQMSAKRLSSIFIYNSSSQIIESIFFNHSFSLNYENSYRMFLKSIQSSSKGTFSFDYDSNLKSFPSLSSRKTDHWGYWNGKNIDIGYVPIVYLDDQDSSLYNISGSLKDSDFNYAKKGALTKITYPSGGYSSIEYEAHSIEKRWNKSVLNSSGIPEVSPSSFKAGGVRVKCIRNYTEEGLSDEYTYEYKKGVLNSMPRYVFAQSFRTAGLNDAAHEGLIINYAPQQCAPRRDPIVSYGSVSVIYKDKSKTSYDYYSFEDLSDSYMSSSATYPQKYEMGCKIDLNSHYILLDEINRCRDLLLPPSIDYCYMRGKLKAEEEYDSQGRLLKTTQYDYSAPQAPYISVLYNLYLGFQKVFFTHIYPELKKIIVTDYYADNTYHTIRKDFSYDSNGRLMLEEQNVVGDTQSYRKYYRYSADVEHPYSSYWGGRIKDEVHTHIIDSLEFLTLSRSFNYNNNSLEHQFPNPGPVSIYQYDIEPQSLLHDRDRVFQAGRMGSLSSCQILYDTNNYFPLSINTQGRILNLSWDAYNKNLIQIEKDGHICSYIWKDGVGITQEKHNFGLTRNYSYDSRNRLIRESDCDNNILKEYTHHLASDLGVNPRPEFGENYSICTTYSGSELSLDRTIDSSSTMSYSDVDIYNSLGYIVQRQSLSFTDSTSHLALPIIYDSHHRADSISFLPYVYSGVAQKRALAIREQKEYYLTQYLDSLAFSESHYESSPIGELLSQTKAGERFREYGSNDRCFSYSLNKASDRVLRFSLTDSTICKSLYNEGLLKKKGYTDEDGIKTEEFTGANGRLNCVRRFLNDSTYLDVNYIYDSKDSLICIVQPSGVSELPVSFTLNSDFAKKHCFVFIRDARGRVITRQVPSAGNIEYVYDNKDRLLLESNKELLKSGIWKLYSYDNQNRHIETKLVFSSQEPELLRTNILYGAPLSSITSDANCILEQKDYYLTVDSLSFGLLKHKRVYLSPTIKNNSPYRDNSIYKDISFTYDKNGNIISKTQKYSDGYTILTQYQWDYQNRLLASVEQHNPTSSQSSFSLNTLYSRDSRGRISAILEYLDNELVNTTNYHYDALGRLSYKSSNQNTIREEFTYTLQDQICEHKVKDSANSEILNSSYIFSNGGRTTQITKNGQIDSFQYDNLGRLTESSLYGHYEYDSNSNLTLWESTWGYHEYYNYLGNRVVGPSYDAMGRIIYDSFTDCHIEYDIEGQANSIIHNTDTLYIGRFYNGSKFAESYDLGSSTAITGNSTSYYNKYYRESIILSDNQQIIESIKVSQGRIFNEDGESKYLYYVHDDKESTELILDIQNAQIKERNYYQNYGQIANPNNDKYTANRYRFAGKEEILSESIAIPYVDFSSRLYSPKIKRWLSPDPQAHLYPQFSPYGYCGGDPINFKDTDGKHIVVSSTGDGTYIVISGVQNEDKSVYLDNNGKRSTLGHMLTEHSFFGDNGSPIIGAIIDMNDRSGQEFLDSFMSNPPDIIDYIKNAKNNKPYDFKSLNKEKALNENLYYYRGMPISLMDGTHIFSARDVGNFTAGWIVKKRSVLSIKYAQIGFDIYNWLSNKFKQFHEGDPSKTAQEAGYNYGEEY